MAGVGGTVALEASWVVLWGVSLEWQLGWVANGLSLAPEWALDWKGVCWKVRFVSRVLGTLWLTAP